MSFHLECAAEMSRAAVWYRLALTCCYSGLAWIRIWYKSQNCGFCIVVVVVVVLYCCCSVLLLLYKRNLFINLEAFEGTWNFLWQTAASKCEGFPTFRVLTPPPSTGCSLWRWGRSQYPKRPSARKKMSLKLICLPVEEFCRLKQKLPWLRVRKHKALQHTKIGKWCVARLSEL